MTLNEKIDRTVNKMSKDFEKRLKLAIATEIVTSRNIETLKEALDKIEIGMNVIVGIEKSENFKLEEE